MYCAQKQSTSLKAYKKWFKALLESSQALMDGRNEAADLEKELKLREKDLQVPHSLAGGAAHPARPKGCASILAVMGYLVVKPHTVVQNPWSGHAKGAAECLGNWAHSWFASPLRTHQSDAHVYFGLTASLCFAGARVGGHSLCG